MEETPAVAAAEPAAPKGDPSSSAELRAARENKDIPLPNQTSGYFAEDFATDILGASLSITENTLTARNDTDAEPTQDWA